MGVDGRCSGGIAGGGTSIEAGVAMYCGLSTVFIEMLIWELGPNLDGIDTFLAPGPPTVCICIVEL